MLRKTVVIILSMAGICLVLVLTCSTMDRESIRMAKVVDLWIRGFCDHELRLPRTDELQTHFPDLNPGTDWFFFTDDSTFLTMQYPVTWWHSEAIGTCKFSEFTATPYGYTVEYRCPVGNGDR